MKTYHVVITSYDDETKETETHVDKDFNGLSILADNTDGESFHEIVLHDNIMGLAQKIHQSKNFSKAAKLVSVLDGFRNRDSKDAEDALASMIFGGMMDGGEQ